MNRGYQAGLLRLLGTIKLPKYLGGGDPARTSSIQYGTLTGKTNLPPVSYNGDGDEQKPFAF